MHPTIPPLFVCDENHLPLHKGGIYADKPPHLAFVGTGVPDCPLYFALSIKILAFQREPFVKGSLLLSPKPFIFKFKRFF